MKSIAVIGGGAAGLAAAIACAHELNLQQMQARVTVYEAASRIGASILATGNGRCNISNAHIELQRYHNSAFVSQVFAAMPPDEVWRFFSELGLVCVDGGEGRLYPITNKANSVLDVLRFELADAGVHIACEKRLHALEGVDGAYRLRFFGGSVAQVDAVILACGGTTLFQGAAGDEIELPAALRSALQPLRAVLGPLRTDTAAIKGLNNIRVRARITLCAKDAESCPKGVDEAGVERAWAEEGCAAESGCLVEEGELLFRDYGVSGIAIFNLSRFAQPGDLLLIDLLPQIDKEALREDLLQRVQTRHARSAVEQLAGLLLAPVARALCKLEGISPDHPLSSEGAERLANAAKALPLTVEGIGDARQCQVHRGGIAVDAIDPSTMGLVGHSGLFAAGELLDVDGPCGGYNLHWAWASGLVAGRAAAQAVTRCVVAPQTESRCKPQAAVSHAAAQQTPQTSSATAFQEGAPHD